MKKVDHASLAQPSTGSALRRSFYHRADGSRDPVTLLLDCLCCPLYFFARQRYGEIANPYPVFLTDPSLKVVSDTAGRPVSINLANRRLYEEAFVLEKSQDNPWPVSLSILEGILDDGEMVLLLTHAALIPSITAYDPRDSLLPYFGKGSSHLFLVVGHDVDDFFYVDMPDDSGSSRFVAHADNRDVGRASKRSMHPAFMRQLDFYTVRVRDDYFSDYQPEAELRAFLSGLLEREEGTRQEGDAVVHTGDAALACIEAFLASCVPSDFDLPKRQLTDTAYSMYFLSLEVAYKFRILATAIGASGKDFIAGFSRSCVRLDALVEHWERIAAQVSPFNKAELAFSLRDPLLALIGEARRLETSLVADLRSELTAGGDRVFGHARTHLVPSSSE